LGDLNSKIQVETILLGETLVNKQGVGFGMVSIIFGIKI
jgi:hypothetical protein